MRKRIACQRNILDPGKKGKGFYNCTDHLHLLRHWRVYDHISAPGNRFYSIPENGIYNRLGSFTHYIQSGRNWLDCRSKLPDLPGCWKICNGKNVASKCNCSNPLDLSAIIYEAFGSDNTNYRWTMRKLLMMIALLPLLVLPVKAAEIEAPTVPQTAEEVFPEDPASFTDGIAEILSDCEAFFRPAMLDCVDYCVKILAIVMLASIFSGGSKATSQSVTMAATLSIAVLLLTPTNNLIYLGRDTIQELTDYGKLLLPVMATALAAQGATSSSAALYAGTACLNAVLSSIITAVLIPLIYIYLVLSTACSVLEEDMLKKTKDFAKWLLTWCLKIILYIFTGYMTITGVISGAVDASAMKATKITISGVVPVVGGIISDASEAILLSAGIMKNSAGIYGILALVSILIGPFVKIGVQYLVLKVTGGLCQVFSSPKCSQLILDFTGAMGYILAMTGTVCLLQLISTVCFMRGVGI